MISRPTTDQLIADVCQDLVDAVLPALTDETLQVRVAMAETVLRNAAARAAHEIAWMTDETATLIEYANTVNARIPNVELRLGEGVLVDELPGLVVHLVDIGLKLRPFHSPLTAAADLDGLEFPVADERVSL